MRKTTLFSACSRLLCLALPIALLLAFAGCNLPEGLWNEYAGLPPFESSREFSYSADFTAIEEKMARVRELIGAGTDYETFYALYEELNEADSDYMLDQRTKYELLRDLDRSNEAYTDGYDRCRAFNREFLLWLIETEELIAASAFRSLYYEGMSDEEIADYLREIKGAYSEEERALQERIDGLEDAFYNGTAEDLYALYAELITARNALAELNGYGDYLSYAFAELYERSYTVSEARQICDLAATYLAPTARELGERYDALRAEARFWSQGEIDAYNAFWYRGFQRYGAKAYLDAYADAVGGDLQATYHALWEDGYYFYGNDTEHSLHGAYQGYLEEEQAPFLYFGPYYQDVMTVAHEFGHYYHATKGDNEDYDLLELHSQGSEMLFMCYFEQCYGDFGISDRCAELIVLQQYADVTDIIVNSAAVQLFEELCYAAAEPSPDGLADIMEDVLKKYGLASEDASYILEAAIGDPGYYISYAASGVAALSLAGDAKADLAAAARYEQLCCMADDVKLAEALQSVGMPSIFDENAYRALRDRFAAA